MLDLGVSECHLAMIWGAVQKIDQTSEYVGN